MHSVTTSTYLPNHLQSTLDDLRASDDQLSGMDAMELRGMATQNPMVPSRDLTDPLGLSIMSYAEGELSAVQSYVEKVGRDAAKKEMEAKRWGPTRIPIFNVILQFLHHAPAHQQALLDLTSYLAHDLHVAVDGTDVTGASALYWSISTKPFAEPAFAAILFSAGGSVNQKSRFGSTCASEIAFLAAHARCGRDAGVVRAARRGRRGQRQRRHEREDACGYDEEAGPGAGCCCEKGTR
jgi:hypothetical protein